MSQSMATFFNRLNKVTRKGLLRNILLLLPGIAADIILHFDLVRRADLLSLFNRLTWAYISVVLVMVSNSVLLALMDIYGRSEKSRNHPLKALFQGLQVALFFVGGIVVATITRGEGKRDHRHQGCKKNLFHIYLFFFINSILRSLGVTSNPLRYSALSLSSISRSKRITRSPSLFGARGDGSVVTLTPAGDSNGSAEMVSGLSPLL